VGEEKGEGWVRVAKQTREGEKREREEGPRTEIIREDNKGGLARVAVGKGKQKQREKVQWGRGEHCGGKVEGKNTSKKGKSGDAG